jgi:quercetin dioxygenase-like cupin family protein
MKTRRTSRLSLQLLAVLVFVASGLMAQDAAQVTPKVVKVKFENEKVRVLEVTSHPGDKEMTHSHPANVVYVLEGGTLRITTADGKTSDVTFKTGDTLYREPVTHSAENIGKTTFHVIIVELKKP